MGNRTRSRETAMQALFYMDMREDISEEGLENFCQCFPPSKKVASFFFELVKGVMKEQKEIDSLMDDSSSNWKIARMACVDRNILRIAIYEMLHCPGTPMKVAINEAINMGKKFGTDESGAFINGILDTVRMIIEEKKPAR